MNIDLEILQGRGPIVLGLPHSGTQIPTAVAATLNDTGLALADTDWHVDKLYADLRDDVTTVRTPIHRYVIDVNRDPSDISLYPGQNTTSLCPLTDFDGRSIYREHAAPDAAETERRRQAYHAPYHAAVAGELARVRERHGFAILYDCHSIRSHVPFLFHGKLADFNIGTNSGNTCDPQIESLVQARCAAADQYTHVMNGRFKGGWTTRHYGCPSQRVHAIQMELAQSTYMTEVAPWTWLPERAETLRTILSLILRDLSQWSPA